MWWSKRGTEARRLRAARLCWVGVVVVFGGAAVARGDEVAAYLQQRGLDGLLAVHLEERLESVGGDERESLVLQLVGIYARLLDSTADPVLRIVPYPHCA